MLIVCLTIVGSGVALKNLFSEKEAQHETTSTEKEPAPELSLEVEILDTEQEVVKEEAINEIYEGELAFEHANPTKNYLITIKVLDEDNREFVGPDNNALKLEEEVILGKEKGKIHLVLKGTKPMVEHIQKLKNVQVSADMTEKK